jgi:methylthioribose-1-phosphate isomerase
MRTVAWNPQGPTVQMIDQRLLPTRLQVLDLHSVQEVAQAIRDMAVRGAPAIGASAAFGLALAAERSTAVDAGALLAELRSAADQLRAARPTAINLAWAIERMLERALRAESDGPKEIRRALVEEAELIAEQDIRINRQMGRHGADLIRDGDTLIHHCNTGALATVDYGTALGVIRTAHEQGKAVHVLVDETRPRLQGARLTAWELEQYGIPYEIIADNAAGHFLSSGQVAAAFVGADRVAANGDVANKIGTYMLALAAHDNQVPFYVVAPTSTIDLNLPSGKAIPIEERDPSEVLGLSQDGHPVAPVESRARNPAFDVTPQRLITAIVTEAGVIRPPYGPGLAEAVRQAQAQWTSS